MLRELSEQVENVVLDGIGRTTSRIQEQKPLPGDLLESDDAYLVVFDAPGVTRDEVDVRFSDRTVHVRIDRFRETRGTHDDYDVRLRGRGMSRSGSLSLPEHAAVDLDAATATLTSSGTLQVRLPKMTADRTDEPIRIDTGSNTDREDHEGDSTEGSADGAD